MAGHEHMGADHLLRESFLLAARDQMVDQDAQPAGGAWLELSHHRDHIIQAVHRFDDDAELA